MTPDDVYLFFNSNSKTFERLTGMSHASLLGWKKKGYIPRESQIKISDITDGLLQAGEPFGKRRGKKKETCKSLNMEDLKRMHLVRVPARDR